MNENNEVDVQSPDWLNEEKKNLVEKQKRSFDQTLRTQLDYPVSAKMIHDRRQQVQMPC